MALRLALLLLLCLPACAQTTFSGKVSASGKVQVGSGAWILTGFEDGSLGRFANIMGADPLGDDSHDCDPINDAGTAATGSWYVECHMVDNVCPHDCGGSTQFTNRLAFRFCDASAPYNSGTIPCSPATQGELWVGWSQRFDTTLYNSMDDSDPCAGGTNHKWWANRHPDAALEGWTVGVAGEAHDCTNPTLVRIADDGAQVGALYTGISMGPNVWQDWLYKLTYENGNQTCSSTWTKLHSVSSWTNVEDHRCFTRTGEDHTVLQEISFGVFNLGPFANGKSLIDNVVIARCDPRTCAPTWGNNN